MGKFIDEKNSIWFKSVHGPGYTFFFSELRKIIGPDNLDTVELEIYSDLCKRRQYFFDLDIVKENTLLVTDLCFCPELTARQIRYHIQKAFDKTNPFGDVKHYLRVQISLNMISDKRPVGGVNISLETSESSQDPWMEQGFDLASVYIPALIGGIKNIYPPHIVENHRSFHFPIYDLGDMETVNYDRDGHTRSTKPFITRSEVLHHHRDYCMIIAAPAIIKQYAAFRNNEPLTEAQMKNATKQIRTFVSEVIRYTVIQYDKVKVLRQDSPDQSVFTGLSVIVHEPDLTNKENDFFIFEYVLLESVDGKGRISAMTASVSGELPVVSSEIMKLPKTLSRH